MDRTAAAALCAGLLVLLSPPSPARAQASQRWLLAISKSDHTLAMVDPGSLQVAARFPVGPDPHEVAVSADGRTAYVSNTGAGLFHQIDVIDLEARKVLPSIDTGPFLGPHGLAYVEGKLWFTAQGAKAVARYDPETRRVDWTIGTGQDVTHMIHVSQDARRISTTNVDSGTVSLLEFQELPQRIPPSGVVPAVARPRMEWVQTLVPSEKGAEGFDVSPDGRELWAATPRGAVRIIDLVAKAPAATIEAHVPGLHRLKFTPDGRRVLVVSIRTGDLLVYDAKSRQEVKRLRIGHGAGMMIDAAGNRAYISCTPDNYISVIDLGSLEEVARIDAGARPDGTVMAETPSKAP